MSFRHILKSFACVVAALFVAGCIVVKDAGPYWDTAQIDEALEGRWNEAEVQPGRKADWVMFTRDTDRNALVMLSDDDDEPLYARSIEIAGKTFMLMRKDGEDELMMHRYAVDGGTLTMLNPNNEKLEDFEGWNPVPEQAYVEDNVAIIEQLNDDTMALLEKLAADPAYWQTGAVFRRQAAAE